jgi:hypothetical protein
VQRHENRRRFVMPTRITDSAVRLAEYLGTQQVGRGIFRLHGVHEGACACGDPDCANAGKHPAERWGATCTLNPRAVERKFRLDPDAGLGLATGRGLLVLDFDAGKGGLDSLDRLTSEFPVLEDAPQVETGGGGKHVYLRVPDGVYVPSRANALNRYRGVDVRCAGGYVVTPPTEHRSGRRYAWITLPDALPRCPGVLITLLHRREAPRERGGVDRKRSGLPLFPDKIAMLRDGIPLDGGQRTNICGLARALLEVPRSVDETTDIIWAALLKSEWSRPEDPWTKEQVREIVVDIEASARRPGLRIGTPRIRIKGRR